MGTEPSVGPRGAIPNGDSDFGLDRISPRRFDPMGTHDTRAPAREESVRLSTEIRKGSRF